MLSTDKRARRNVAYADGKRVGAAQARLWLQLGEPQDADYSRVQTLQNQTLAALPHYCQGAWMEGFDDGWDDVEWDDCTGQAR